MNSAPIIYDIYFSNLPDVHIPCVQIVNQGEQRNFTFPVMTMIVFAILCGSEEDISKRLEQ